MFHIQLNCGLVVSNDLVPGDEHGDGHEADRLAVHEEPLELGGGEGVGGEGGVHPLKHLRGKRSTSVACLIFVGLNLNVFRFLYSKIIFITISIYN